MKIPRPKVLLPHADGMMLVLVDAAGAIKKRAMPLGRLVRGWLVAELLAINGLEQGAVVEGQETYPFVERQRVVFV